MLITIYSSVNAGDIYFKVTRTKTRLEETLEEFDRRPELLVCRNTNALVILQRVLKYAFLWRSV